MNGDFQKRLFHYQVKPPASTWNSLAARLDEPFSGYPEKLLAYQQSPPAAIWDQIAPLIDIPGREGKIFSMRKLVRYAAVAVLILLAGFGIFLMQDSGREAKQESLTVQKNPVSIPGASSPAATVPEIKGNATAKTGPAVIAALPVQKKISYSRLAASKILKPVYRSQANLQVSEQAPNLKEKNMVNTTWAERYMIATSTSGKVVRLPKKAYAAFACVEATDLACKEKMASMQSRLAAASVTTDFAGFLDLLNNLQDNQ